VAISPMKNTPQRLWHFHCVLAPKFYFRESKVLMMRAEQENRLDQLSERFCRSETT